LDLLVALRHFLAVRSRTILPDISTFPLIEYWDSWRELNGLNESEAARDDKRDK
jgi:hypothetical protein